MNGEDVLAGRARVLEVTGGDVTEEFIQGGKKAVAFARAQYAEKHPKQAVEMAGWDDGKFLDKAKVCIGGGAPANWAATPASAAQVSATASLTCCISASRSGAGAPAGVADAMVHPPWRSLVLGAALHGHGAPPPCATKSRIG